ncbi:MAG: GNAT family protein [Mobilitalea sp.]
MLRLRPFKICDAKDLLSWVQEERVFSMWCANKFEYPLTENQIKAYKEIYDADEKGWMLSALNESGKVVGHLLMRNADYEKESIHFGFIIVDPSYRGKGYGKEMVKLALRYAFEILHMKHATLGVYANNEAAHNCYKAVGFVDQEYFEDFFPYKDEKWGLYTMQADQE